jgi:putative transcriptional regulator
MSGGAITRYKSDPDNPYQMDWTAADALTDEDIHARALSDPDAQPLTPEQLSRARRVVDVRRIRERLGFSQEEFSHRFGLRLELIRGWEDRSLTPDSAAITLLRIISAEPETVQRLVAAE